MAKLILLIDDSITILMSIQHTLENSGYKVSTAQDGDDGLNQISCGLRPDLIITDINMPRMSGIEFIQKARPLVKFIPILALTTHSQSASREEAKKYGATGWLVKPVGMEDLLKVVNQVLNDA